MRDAAYEGLAYRRRRDLHVRAGESIERQRATDDADLDLLALHFFHGRVHDKAWLYSRGRRDAAERSSRSSRPPSIWSRRCRARAG